MKKQYNNIGIIITLFAAFSITFLAACKKYHDPPPSNGYPGQDTSFYCNNPYAINYNWGFPGTPDSSICFFPEDAFKGTWLYIDTIYKPDSTIANIENKVLTFTGIEDTSRNHLAITGWCSNNDSIFITADKYQNAITDTLIPYTNGSQFLCSQTDTISGTLNKYYGNDSLMKIYFTTKSPQGTLYHSGTAYFQ